MTGIGANPSEVARRARAAINRGRALLGIDGDPFRESVGAPDPAVRHNLIDLLARTFRGVTDAFDLLKGEDELPAQRVSGKRAVLGSSLDGSAWSPLRNLTVISRHPDREEEVLVTGFRTDESDVKVILEGGQPGPTARRFNVRDAVRDVLVHCRTCEQVLSAVASDNERMAVATREFSTRANGVERAFDELAPMLPNSHDGLDTVVFPAASSSACLAFGVQLDELLVAAKRVERILFEIAGPDTRPPIPASPSPTPAAAPPGTLPQGLASFNMTMRTEPVRRKRVSRPVEHEGVATSRNVKPNGEAVRRKAYKRAIVLTALRVEFAAVRAHLSEVTEDVHPEGTVYDVGNFQGDSLMWSVAVAEIGAGNTGAALEAERAIRRFRPHVALFVGVAGGVKDLEIGDVVAATKVYRYESGKDTTQLATRPEIFRSTYALEQRSRAVARGDAWHRRIPHILGAAKPKGVVGPIAAGEKVVASTQSEVAALLRASYGDTLAVEMEGSGFLQAGHANSSVNVLLIRGISDLLDKKSDADRSGSQERASANASAFAFQVLSGFSPKPRGRRS